MNSEEEGGEVGKGGIFSKIHYGDWGGGGRDLWQDLLRRLEGLEGGIFGKIHYGDWRDWRVGSLARSTTGGRCLSFTIGSGILLKNCCLFVLLEI